MSDSRWRVLGDAQRFGLALSVSAAVLYLTYKFGQALDRLDLTGVEIPPIDINNALIILITGSITALNGVIAYYFASKQAEKKPA